MRGKKKKQASIMNENEPLTKRKPKLVSMYIYIPTHIYIYISRFP